MDANKPTDGPPDPASCTGPADVGKLLHDGAAEIWYECMHDPRTGKYTWVILPPPEPDQSPADN